MPIAADIFSVDYDVQEKKEQYNLLIIIGLKLCVIIFLKLAH